MAVKKYIYLFFSVAFITLAGCQKDDSDEPLPGGDESELTEKPELREAVDEMAAEAPSVYEYLSGIEVWQDGYKPSGAWINGTSSDTRHQMWSVTKTFTGMAIGMAIDEGKVSLSDKVEDMFPDEISAAGITGEELERVKKLTVKELLTMTDGHEEDATITAAKRYSLSLLKYFKTGHDYSEDMPEVVTNILNDIDKTLPQLFFDADFTEDPGDEFVYDTFASCLLAEILLQKTGLDIHEYLDSRLLEPLGFGSSLTWDKIQGSSAGGWGLHLTTDEMITFGRLLLDGGEWDGQQLIPASWVSSALSEQVDFGNSGSYGYSTTGYGYQIWHIKDGWLCSGLFGQYIAILPTKKAVIALTTDFPLTTATLLPLIQDQSAADGTKALELAWEYIVPAL
jgi:CubicO group peptidase (beta-lactamase class C family)